MKPKCLIVDSDPAHARALTDIATACGYEVDCADTGSSSPMSPEVTGYDVLFLDLARVSAEDNLSISDLDLRGGTELLVMAEADDPDVADQVIREGASYFFCKPLEASALKPLLEDIASEAAPENIAAVSLETCGVDQFGLLRGSSRGMRKLYRNIRKIAQNDVTTMIVGESGTGKELIAQTIHMLSERREGPFSAFNCGAVAANLAESELFGHEKGAFSGATKRHHGHFERANGGTLLLDEITEMDIDLQTKLLRVLETRKLRRLGAEEDIDFDVRIICASNRSPEQAVREGSLREDLYYRLSQFPRSMYPPCGTETRILSGWPSIFCAH
ncbi:MAG: sigma-54-dependent Fis family transcriptional regulator [Halioglobus sp.]|nr:sigma-54-dependent Fis family transcriptional regulator [Halioglobus sp.]